MRYFQIDFLRAVSIVGMIAIHVYAYVKLVPLDSHIWNWLHFVVVGFVFCSGYVLFAKYKDVSRRDLLAWWRKRIVRLLTPFYLYLLVHTVLALFLPQFFDGFGLHADMSFLFKSITLFGGVSVSWLPLLFVQMMLLFPLLTWVWRRRSYLFVYLFVVACVTLYFTFGSFPYEYYKYVMWLPWSLVMLLSFLFFTFQNRYKTSLLPLYFSLGCALLFFCLLPLWEHLDKSYKLTGNKYPPGFFYLSYASALSFLVLGVGNLDVWSRDILKRLISFISTQSYTLFFVHYIVLDFSLQTKLFVDLEHPFVYFLFVTLVSLCMTYFLACRNKIYSYIRK